MSTASPRPLSPPAPTGKDRFIAKLMSFLARAIYRDVQVHWTEPPSADAPTLSVANHFGGFSDGLVLLYTFPRRPGIIARDVIWKIPVAGRLMTWIGGIPVHKPEDSPDVSANDQMFGSCYAALRDGGHLLIFPEGVTRNEPSIAMVKTGAARIALGARASGADALSITPVGIHYEDKAALRSRVVVNAGRPIDVDEFVSRSGGEAVTADDREAVRDLTTEIDKRLRRAAPDYDDWQEAHVLTAASEVALRSRLDDPADPVPIGLRDRLANVLADRPADQRAGIAAAMTAYRETLDGVGLTDAEARERVSARRAISTIGVQLLVGLLLAPFALVGAVINVVPYLVVKAAGMLRVAPSMHATIKPLVAALAFGITWGLVIWFSLREFGWVGAAAAFVLMPVYATATVLFAERLVLVGRTLRRWRADGRRTSFADRLDEEQRRVVAAVLVVG